MARIVRRRPQRSEQRPPMIAPAAALPDLTARFVASGEVRAFPDTDALAALGASVAAELPCRDALMQEYDDQAYKTDNGLYFIAEQFTRDYVVKVDAHSNSPIFTEDLRSLAFNMFKAGAIDKESLIDLLEPPMKQELKDRLKRNEEKQAQMQAMQGQQGGQPPGKGKKPDLKAVGEE